MPTFTPDDAILLRVPRQLAPTLYALLEENRLNMVENIADLTLEPEEVRAAFHRGSLRTDYGDELDAQGITHLEATIAQMVLCEEVLAQLRAQGILVQGIR